MKGAAACCNKTNIAFVVRKHAAKHFHIGNTAAACPRRARNERSKSGRRSRRKPREKGLLDKSCLAPRNRLSTEASWTYRQRRAHVASRNGFAKRLPNACQQCNHI
jgi:hypothetical protein